MVFFNYSTMQMAAKVVYYGPGLCGKTTNLHYIYGHTTHDSRGEMVSLETETDRTLFFDLLPLDVGSIAGFNTRIQLYTVPGQVFYNTTRKLVLKGVDGVVFVVDSQRAMLQATLDSFRNLEENLSEMGLAVDSLPLVLQYNKRDLADIYSVEELNQAINRHGWPWYESSAVSGQGVFETLKGISKYTLLALKKRLGRSGAEAPARLSAPGGALGQPARPGIPPAAQPVAPATPATGAAAGPGGGGAPAPPQRSSMPSPAAAVAPAAPSSPAGSPVPAGPAAGGAEPLPQASQAAQAADLAAAPAGSAPHQPASPAAAAKASQPSGPAEPLQPFQARPASQADPAGPAAPPPAAAPPGAPAAAGSAESTGVMRSTGKRSSGKSRSFDVLSELEKLRREAMQPAAHPATSTHQAAQPGAQAAAGSAKSAAGPAHAKTAAGNGRAELSRNIEMTLKRSEFARARRILLSFQVEDEQHRVVDAVRDLPVEIKDTADLEKLLLRFNIALHAKE
jgi:signal recognition particle receptor subunit beta